MTDFFIEKFELEYQSNELLIRYIEDQEDLVSHATKRIISHIINVHHIWLARLKDVAAESDLWDSLPIAFLSDLNRQNYLETLACIKDFDSQLPSENDSAFSGFSEGFAANVLFHILQHSSYHRGQVVHELKMNKLNYPDMQWIPID